VDEIAKNLQAMKVILYGDGVEGADGRRGRRAVFDACGGAGETEPVADMVAQLAQEVYNSDLLQTLIPRLGKVDFEVRRGASQRRRLGRGGVARWVLTDRGCVTVAQGHGAHLWQPAEAADRHAAADGRLPVLA
jgi:hypothetical protein